MKKSIILLTVIILIYFIAGMTVPEFMPAATQVNQSKEIYQTWEEFLESGVKIEYDEAPTLTDDTNY